MGIISLSHHCRHWRSASSLRSQSSPRSSFLRTRRFQPGVGEGSTSTLGSLQPSVVNWVWSCRPATLLLVCYSSCEEFLCSFQGLCTLWKECHVPVCLAEDWEVVNWYWWIEGFLWQSEQSSCSFIRDFFLWGMMTFLIYIVCKAELTIWKQNLIMPMEIYLVAF